jgi:hypothetical protein
MSETTGTTGASYADSGVDIEDGLGAFDLMK